MSYKRLGDLINFISVKNRDGEATILYGINIDKFFMPSVANTIGVDLTKYKVVDKFQFACNRMHVGRDERLPISMSTYDYKFIVSPAYDVFEIKVDDVLPEYLMLWFRRKEFDRQCWFYTDADVRGGLSLDALKAIEIEIPSIEKQQAIVAQYQAVADKIKVNEQICEKLEATAQALYRHWFVDFEFPNEEGKPYKSSGGAMLYNEELEKEIPEGWGVKEFNEIMEKFISKRGKSKSSMNLNEYSLEFCYPVISAMNVSKNKIVKINTIPYISEKEYNEWMEIKLRMDDVILTSEAPLGETLYIVNNSSFALSQRLFALRPNTEKVKGWYLFLWLNSDLGKKELEGKASGTTVQGISLAELKNVKLLIPNIDILISLEAVIVNLFQNIELNNSQNQKLVQLQNLLLSRLAREG